MSLAVISHMFLKWCCSICWLMLIYRLELFLLEDISFLQWENVPIHIMIYNIGRWWQGYLELTYLTQYCGNWTTNIIPNSSQYHHRRHYWKNVKTTSGCWGCNERPFAKQLEIIQDKGKLLSGKSATGFRVHFCPNFFILNPNFDSVHFFAFLPCFVSGLVPGLKFICWNNWRLSRISEKCSLASQSLTFRTFSVKFLFSSLNL